MKNMTCNLTVDTASAVCTHASRAHFRGWAVDFITGANPSVMGTKPYHRRPKEASPPE